MKKEFTCCKFAAFEHFTVYEHPFLLCQHCCCCHIYPAHRSTNSWRLLLLQLYFGTLIFPFQRPNPALSMGLPSKPWVCVSSWNFPPGMLCRMWVTYFGFQEACYCTLKSEMRTAFFYLWYFFISAFLRNLKNLSPDNSGCFISLAVYKN